MEVADVDSAGGTQGNGATPWRHASFESDKVVSGSVDRTCAVLRVVERHLVYVMARLAVKVVMGAAIVAGVLEAPGCCRSLHSGGDGEMAASVVGVVVFL